VSNRALEPFGETVFAVFSRLAREAGAVNLGQGFPDFDGPDWIQDAARDAMRRGHNQYAIGHGAVRLREAVAQRGYYEEFRGAYGLRREVLVHALDRAGLRPIPPEGTYFVMAQVDEEDGDAFVRKLIAERGVAAIPPASFYLEPRHAAGLVRFAFCKQADTLREAAARLMLGSG